MWDHPTPHEQSLERIDEFLGTHAFTFEELNAIRGFYDDNKRAWALRWLRLQAAMDRISTMPDRIIMTG